MTWIKVSVPAESVWEIRLESPEGEDWDMIHRGEFHDTGERTDIVRLENRTGRAVSEKIGIYRFAESSDPNLVNRNGEGDSRPPLIMSFAREMPAGLALAEEWGALNEAGARALNVAGEFDAEISAITAPARPENSPNAALVWSQPIALTPGVRVAIADQRYFQFTMFIKRSRNRALRNVGFTYLELE